VNIDSVRMPISFGNYASKSAGRPLFVMAHLKTSVVEVKTEDNCLAHSVTLDIAKADKVPNCESYLHGHMIRSVVRILLYTTGIDLSGGWAYPN
jgi:hypothetical protein